MTDVFISYADEDARRVRRIVDGFQAAGVAVFFERESRDGVLWMDATAAQIKQSDAVVVVLSKSAAQSERMAWEVDLAARYGKRLFPAVIEADAPIPKAFTDAVERQREIYDDPAGAKAVRVSPPIPLWREAEPKLEAKPAPAATKPETEVASGAPLTKSATAPDAAKTGDASADPPLIDDLTGAEAPAPIPEPLSADTDAPTPIARTLDGEKIRKLVLEVRKSSDAARAAADGPRTSEGLAKSASLVFAQWRAVEDSEDMRALRTFQTEHRDDPYFNERAVERIDMIRRDRVWRRADFAFRLFTGMALVGAAVWALNETGQFDDVVESFAGDAAPRVTLSTGVSDAATPQPPSDALLRIEQLQSQVGIEKKRVAELQALLDNEDPDLGAKLTAAQAALSAAEDRASELDAQLTAATRSLRDEKARAERAMRQAEQARTAAAAAADAREDAVASTASLRDERDRLRAARDDALAELEKAREELASGGEADARLAVVLRERNELRDELAGSRREIADLQTALADASESESELKTEVAGLQRDLRDAEDALAERPTALAAVSTPEPSPGRRTPARGGGGSADILVAHFMERQESVYEGRVQRTGATARFPVLNRSDIFRMQACIERETDYRVGVDGIWGLRTSRAVVGMTRAQARAVTGCIDES